MLLWRLQTSLLTFSPFAPTTPGPRFLFPPFPAPIFSVLINHFNQYRNFIGLEVDWPGSSRIEIRNWPGIQNWIRIRTCYSNRIRELIIGTCRKRIWVGAGPGKMENFPCGCWVWEILECPCLRLIADRVRVRSCIEVALVIRLTIGTAGVDWGASTRVAKTERL